MASARIASWASDKVVLSDQYPTPVAHVQSTFGVGCRDSDPPLQFLHDHNAYSEQQDELHRAYCKFDQSPADPGYAGSVRPFVQSSYAPSNRPANAIYAESPLHA